MDGIEQLREIINRSRRLVFFGGAGVSTASGIPDFRSEDGLYSLDLSASETETAGDAGAMGKAFGGRLAEEILSASFFMLHTEEFFEFYRRYMVHPDAQPNIIHMWLYELEKQDKLRGIITQNIDGLHKKAGNKRVYELHGSIHENYCINCETRYPLEAVMEADGIPRCSKCGGIIKPNVVLYGEALDKYTTIGACREISNADTMIVAGTSLSVEPAASFIEYFSGRNLVVINRDPTPADSRAGLVIRADIAEVISKIF